MQASRVSGSFASCKMVPIRLRLTVERLLFSFFMLCRCALHVPFRCIFVYCFSPVPFLAFASNGERGKRKKEEKEPLFHFLFFLVSTWKVTSWRSTRERVWSRTVRLSASQIYSCVHLFILLFYVRFSVFLSNYVAAFCVFVLGGMNAVEGRSACSGIVLSGLVGAAGASMHRARL